MHYHPDRFYENRDEATRSSAEVICPLVLQLTNAKSLIDVGCGVGTWLDVFRKFGVADVLGVEGHWVDRKYLVIPEDSFLYADLTRPLNIQRTFDLAISLEVAEHLPSESAAAFVDSLVRLAQVILFSAAIPGQGGVNHVNEQWPDYWVKLYKEKGYEVIDCIRKEVWQNQRVVWWYAQNILVFVRRDCLKNYPRLKEEFGRTVSSQLAIVHPNNYTGKCKTLLRLQEKSSRLEGESRSVRQSFKALTRNTIGALGLRLR